MEQSPGVKPSRVLLSRQRVGDFVWGRDPHYGHLFDFAMIALIMISIVVMSVETLPGFPRTEWSGRLVLFDWFIVVVFTVEYGLRLWTAPEKWKYVFSFWGFIDLMVIAPFWIGLAFGMTAGETLFTLRVLRLAKLLRFVANMEVIDRAFQLVWREMLVFFLLAVMMMFITAVGIYTFEHRAQPEAFPSIPHSFWFAVTTLTTVGYGDIYPVTVGGKMFTFIILMIGLGIVALPSGLVSSAFTQAREEEKQLKARQAEEKLRRAAEREAARMSADPD